LVDNGFYKASETNSACLLNPEHCADGLSFSLFYFADYEETDTELLHENSKDSFPREYIISSGGEEGTPGVALYRKGAYLGAVVSTGNLTWSVEVMGAAPQRRQWVNFGVRWKMPTVQTVAEYTAAK